MDAQNTYPHKGANQARTHQRIRTHKRTNARTQARITRYLVSDAAEVLLAKHAALKRLLDESAAARGGNSDDCMQACRRTAKP